MNTNTRPKIAGFDPLQRTVAWRGGKVPSNATPSVFAAGKPTKKVIRIDPYDPETIPIVPAVPVPPALRNGGQRSRAARLLDRMKAGDMVELERAHAMSLKSYAKKVGLEVTIRKHTDNVWRVWRMG